MAFRKRILPLLLLGIATLLCGCQDRVQSKLEKIDSLLTHDNVDAAHMYLRTLPPIQPENKQNMAYYTLLKTEILYRKQLPIANDSIDYPMFYYEQKGLKDKLARAYYYKGVIQFFYRNNTLNAITLLKKAENIARGQSDPTLLHKIYSTICYVNLINKNYATALVYARLARNIGYQTQNKMWIAYSLTYTANAYSGLEEPDSNLKYLLKSLAYYQYLSRENQSVLLANIGDAYNQKKDSVKAITYILKALKERPDNYTYAILTDLYIQRGENDKAYKLLLKALENPDVYTQEKALYNLFRLKRKMGDYQEAARFADSLLVFKEKQQKEWQQNNIYEIQNRYDKEESERRIRSYKFYTGSLIGLFILIIITFLLYHKYKVTKARRNLLQKHLLLNEYSGKLDEMKQSQSITHKELTALRQKVNNLKDKEVRTLSNGKQLYESIMQNRNTVHWSSQDFLDFLEYCKFIDAAFITQLDEIYFHLSPRQYLFLIATKRMNKNETEIGSILAISPSSVRSIKSRIKNKRTRKELLPQNKAPKDV